MLKSLLSLGVFKLQKGQNNITNVLYKWRYIPSHMMLSLRKWPKFKSFCIFASAYSNLVVCLFTEPPQNWWRLVSLISNLCNEFENVNVWNSRAEKEQLCVLWNNNGHIDLEQLGVEKIMTEFWFLGDLSLKCKPLNSVYHQEMSSEAVLHVKLKHFCLKCHKNEI